MQPTPLFVARGSQEGVKPVDPWMLGHNSRTMRSRGEVAAARMEDVVVWG